MSLLNLMKSLSFRSSQAYRALWFGIILSTLGASGCAELRPSWSGNPEVIVTTGNLEMIKDVLADEGRQYGYQVDHQKMTGYEVDLNDEKTLVLYKPANERESTLLSLAMLNRGLAKDMDEYRAGPSAQSGAALKGTAGQPRSDMLFEKVEIFFFGVRNGRTLIIAHLGLRARYPNGLALVFLDMTRAGTVYGDLYSSLDKVKAAIERKK